jgi:hypothetical protein
MEESELLRNIDDDDQQEAERLEEEYRRELENTDKAQHVTAILTSYVNSFSTDHEYFIKAMSREHRTLQQSATKLMFQWIEYAASDDYRFDKRNEATHEICKQIVAKFKIENGYNVKPSDYLPCV